MNNKYFKPIAIVVAVLVITLTTIASYAYFTANINSNAQESVITTGNMAIEFIDGNVIGLTENMIPGEYIEKQFTVKNIGDVEAYYDIYLNDVVNTFNTKSDLVYELISENGSSVVETTCPDRNSKISSNITIGVGEKHNYTLKITFKETNRNQDDNKGKSFSAIVDLVEKASINSDNLIEKMTTLAANGATDLAYDGIATLGEYGTLDNNLRYVGANPNNYVYYNCSTINPDEMNDTTCEKWRIVGLFNNVEDQNGNASSYIKIMKHDLLGVYNWDSSEDTINDGWGVNQWGESTYKDGTPYEGADLMRELNTDYLGNITVGTDGKWYGSYGERVYDMPTTLLNQTAQSMIQTVKWYTGPIDLDNNDHYYWGAKRFYDMERRDIADYSCYDYEGNPCEYKINRTTSWVGKVALINISDYAYSSIGAQYESANNLLNIIDTYEDCVSIFPSNWAYSEDELATSCAENSWIYLNHPGESYYWQWTLTPGGGSEDAYNVMDYGQIYSYTLDGGSETNVRPALFLKSQVGIVSGDGSESNPYKLTM